jgi:trigger factor
VVLKAKVTDTDGNTVDTAEMFGEPAETVADSEGAAEPAENAAE